MSDFSPSLGLQYLMPAQAQKHVTVNEALGVLDDLGWPSVGDWEVLEPPASPIEGQASLIGEPAAGDWQGQDGKLAVWRDGAWQFHTPQEGWLLWNENSKSLHVRTGGTWRDLAAPPQTLQELELLGVGTNADVANPVSVKANNALFSASNFVDGGTGDLRLTLNKEDADNVGSLLLQSGWQGRAEIGLVGNDDLTLRVSADGVAFEDALAIDRNTAVVRANHGIEISSLNGGAPGGFRNLVINGDFAIWQRGTSHTGMTARSYQADRWYVWSGGAQTMFDVSRQETAPAPFSCCARVQRAQGTAGTGALRINQVIDPQSAARMAGQTVTLRFHARKGADYSGSGNALDVFLRECADPDGVQNSGGGFQTGALANPVNTEILLNDDWQVNTFTTTVSDGTNLAALYFSFTPQETAGHDDWFEITGVQLECGPMATPFEFRHPAIEMGFCEYFYQKRHVWVPDTDATLGLIRMRKAPVVSGGGNGFDASSTSENCLIAHQSAAGLQILELDAEY